MSRIAFVTGGTGFVGSAIARTLVENGIRVTALVRKSSSSDAIARLHSTGVTVVVGDILDPASYVRHLAGCAYVFHAAAIHQTWTNEPQCMYRTNVDATKSLLFAAVDAGIEQFVYTSSVKTIGLHGEGMSDESDPYNLWAIDNEYGRTKYLAEEFLLGSRERIGIKILNPAAVLGPGGGLGTPLLQLLRQSAMSRFPVYLDTCMGIVDVRDVGLAHFRALERARDKERYILCGANLSLKELIGRSVERAGRSRPLIRIPFPAAYLVAFFDLGLSALKLSSTPPRVTRQSLDIARLKPAFAGGKAAKEFGFSYTDVNKTLDDTMFSLGLGVGTNP